MKKKILLGVICMISGTGLTQNALSNGGFESWEDRTAYVKVDHWSDGNAFSHDQEVLTTTQSSDAYEGNHSVRLESFHSNGDESMGFVLHGQIGPGGPQGGIPYPHVVDSIVGFYKYDIQVGDSATAIVVLKNGGAFIGGVQHTFTGVQTAWTRFSIPVANPFSLQADSILVGFASSNIVDDYVGDGSWLMVDDVHIKNGATTLPDIPNFGFEDWSDVITEEPLNWATFNPYLAKVALTSALKSNDANTGSYAMELTTIDLFGEVFEGLSAYGEVNLSNLTAGIPYNELPQDFSGAYKYTPNGIDTARIGVVFTSNGVVIGGLEEVITGTQTTYQTFNQGGVLPSQPDSMLLYFSSGENIGSKLLIDDMVVSGGNVSIGTFEPIESEFKVLSFPNPVEGNLNVIISGELGKVSIRILNSLGSMVKIRDWSKSMVTQKVNIDCSTLTKGVYFYNVTLGTEQITKKFVVR